MTDKIKLVIEMPKYDYEEVGHLVADGIFEYNGTIATVCKAIVNGTPLDTVKAEIGKCKSQNEMQLSERDTKEKLMISDIYCHIIEILDNIGKTERGEANESND